MAWPPPPLTTTRTNTTVMTDQHPADHNAENLAINDIVAHINAVWTPYTPTLTGAAATLVMARWVRIGRTVIGHAEFTITTTSGAPMAITLPTAAVTPAATSAPIGTAWCFNSGVGHTIGLAFLASTTALNFVGPGPNATAIWGSSTPHAWKNGDALRTQFTYETP